MKNSERPNSYTSPSDQFWEKVRGITQDHLNERSRGARDEKVEQELMTFYRSTPDQRPDEEFSPENQEAK